MHEVEISGLKASTIFGAYLGIMQWMERKPRKSTGADFIAMRLTQSLRIPSSDLHIQLTDVRFSQNVHFPSGTTTQRERKRCLSAHPCSFACRCAAHQCERKAQVRSWREEFSKPQSEHKEGVTHQQHWEFQGTHCELYVTLKEESSSILRNTKDLGTDSDSSLPTVLISPPLVHLY